MPEPNPIRPDDDNRMQRIIKNASFLMMMVLLFLLAIRFVQGQDETVFEITYTEFRAQLRSDNVHEVTVIDRKIEGELRAPTVSQGQEIIRFEVTLPGEMTDGLLEDLEQSDVIIQAESSEPGWGTFLLGALPWLLFIAFWIWIFRTMQGGGNRAFQFGRSKAKLISPESQTVTFSDVAGADEAKEELQEIIPGDVDPQVHGVQHFEGASSTECFATQSHIAGPATSAISTQSRIASGAAQLENRLCPLANPCA